MELLYLALSVSASVGLSVCLSQKFKCPIFQHIIANKYLFHLGDDGRRRRSRGGGGEGGGVDGGGVDGGGSKYIIVKVQTIPELIAYPCLFHVELVRFKWEFFTLPNDFNHKKCFYHSISGEWI